MMAIRRCPSCDRPIETVWGIPIDDIPKMAAVVEAARVINTHLGPGRMPPNWQDRGALVDALNALDGKGAFDG